MRVFQHEADQGFAKYQSLSDLIIIDARAMILRANFYAATGHTSLGLLINI